MKKKSVWSTLVRRDLRCSRKKKYQGLKSSGISTKEQSSRVMKGGITRKRGKGTRRSERRKEIINNAVMNINQEVMKKSRGNSRKEILAERESKAVVIEECKEMMTWTILISMARIINSVNKKIIVSINKNHKFP